MSEPIAPYAPKPDPKLYYFELQVGPATTDVEVAAFFTEHWTEPVQVAVFDGVASQVVRYDIGRPAYLEVPHGAYVRMLTNPAGLYETADVATVALADDPDFIVETPAPEPDGGGLG